MENSIRITIEQKPIDLSPRRRAMTFDTYEAETPKQKQIKEFLQSFPTSWLVFYGDVGTGKTHLSTALLQDRYKKGVSFEIVKFRYIGIDVRADFSKERQIIEHYYAPDVLVIEEIGKGYNTDFERELLFEIVDTRMEHNKQTIFITNLSRDQFLQFIGKPAGDRITSEAQFIHFNWKSYRQKEE